MSCGKNTPVHLLIFFCCPRKACADVKREDFQKLRHSLCACTIQFYAVLYSNRKCWQCLVTGEGNAAEQIELETERLKGLPCVSSRECLIPLPAIIKGSPMFLHGISCSALFVATVTVSDRDSCLFLCFPEDNFNFSSRLRDFRNSSCPSGFWCHD